MPGVWKWGLLLEVLESLWEIRTEGQRGESEVLANSRVLPGRIPVSHTLGILKRKLQTAHV